MFNERDFRFIGRADGKSVLIVPELLSESEAKVVEVDSEPCTGELP